MKIKIFCLRGNVLDVTETHVDQWNQVKGIILPPKDHRLVQMETGVSCAVKLRDHRYTVTNSSGKETVDFSKVVWTHKAAVLAGYESSAAKRGWKAEPETALKRENGRPDPLGILPQDENLSLNHSSGDFEKNFKALVREQGRGADSLLTAKFLVCSMSPVDKSELNKNLLSNGLKTPGDLERLLSKWKSEALLANHTPQRAPRRKRTVSAGYER
jgi:hypothetical protein